MNRNPSASWVRHALLTFLTFASIVSGIESVAAQSSSNPLLTGRPLAGQFTRKAWMDFRQDGASVAASVAAATAAAASASSPTGTEFIPCVQGRAAKSCTVAQIAAVGGASGSTEALVWRGNAQGFRTSVQSFSNAATVQSSTNRLRQYSLVAARYGKAEFRSPTLISLGERRTFPARR